MSTKKSVCLIAMAVMFMASALPVYANWFYEDLGSPAMSGNTSVNVGFTTFTMEGGGGVVGGTSDQGHFAHQDLTGNFEFTTKVASLENGTGSGAQAGIMSRQSLEPGSPFALIAVTPGNGLQFRYRSVLDTAASEVTVSAIVAPTWLRLVKIGSTFTASYSADGNSWTQVATQTVSTIGSVSLTGVVTTSDNIAALCSAVFEKVNVATHVPQAGGNLRMWFRADTGVTTVTGDAVTTWLDQSGLGNHAVQATAGNRPVLVQDGLNGKPIVRFNATAKTYLSVPNNTTMALDRVSAYAVVKRTSGTAAVIILEQFTANTAGFSLQATTATGRAFRINGTIGSDTVPTPGTSFNVLAGTYNMSTRNFFVDGGAPVTGALTAATGAKTNTFYIGGRAATVNLAGDIAEILVYSEAPTEKERKEMDAYFHSKYGVGSVPALSAPLADVTSGTYATSRVVSLSNTPDSEGALIYYTLDDNAALSEWSLYTNPITVGTTSHLRAVAIKTGFQNSPTTERYLTINAETNYVSRDALSLWLKADTGVVVSSGLVDVWRDQSGLEHDASSPVTANYKPTLNLTNFTRLPTTVVDKSRSVIRFSGVTPKKTTLTIPDLPSLDMTKVTVFAVANRADAVSTTSGLIIDRWTTSSGFRLFSAGLNSRSFVLNAGTIAMNSTNSPTDFELIEGAYLQSESKKRIRVDGASDIVPSAQTGVLGGQARPVNIGGIGTTANLNGDIAEILVYNKEFTESAGDQDEYRGIVAYLHEKYGVASAPQARTPTTSLTKNIFSQAQWVDIINNEPGASVYYTIDGTEPTPIPANLYTVPFLIEASTVVRARAVKPRFATSELMAQTVIIDADAAYPKQTEPMLWLRADAGVSTASGTVTEWRDQSGNQFSAQQSKPLQQPSAPAIQSGIKNRPAIWFPASTTNLAHLVINDDTRLNLSATSIFVVGRFIGSPSQTKNTILQKKAASNGFGLSYQTSGKGVQFFTNAKTLSSTEGDVDLFSLSGARYAAGTGHELFYNGKLTLKDTSYATAIGSTTGSNLFIGYANEASSSLNGYIAELLVYDRAITDDERRSLDAYAFVRYGVGTQPQARAPSFSSAEASGNWGGRLVTINNHEPGATVRFTTDGSEPSVDSPIYSSPITLSLTTTVKAIAFKHSFVPSRIAQQNWEINPQWTLTEIGSSPLVEQTFVPSPSWSLSPTGAGFAVAGDKLTFVSVPGIQGSGMEWSSTLPSAGLRGLMARTSQAADSAFIFLGFDSAGQCRFICRAGTAAGTLVNRVISGVPVGAQLRLRLVGNTIFAFTRVTGGDWVQGPGSDLYDSQGEELGRGLTNGSGQPILTYRLGLAVSSAVQGTAVSHSVSNAAVIYGVEQQTVRWHRLIEPRTMSATYTLSKNGFYDGIPGSMWTSPIAKTGMSGGDYIRADLPSDSDYGILSFNSILLGTKKAVDVYIRLVESASPTRSFKLSTNGPKRSTIPGATVISTDSGLDTWIYAGSLAPRTLTATGNDYLDLGLHAIPGANPGFVAFDGVMLVGVEGDQDFNQNGIADESTTQDHLLETGGDYNGDGWSNYWSYLMTGIPLNLSNASYSHYAPIPVRTVTITRASTQPPAVAAPAGSWTQNPIQFQVNYINPVAPVKGFIFSILSGGNSEGDSGSYYSRYNAAIALSKDHVPQQEPISVVTDVNGIAKVWAFNRWNTLRGSPTFINYKSDQYSGVHDNVLVYSYPNNKPGEIVSSPGSQDLKRVLAQPWSQKTPQKSAVVVWGDVMVVGQGSDAPQGAAAGTGFLQVYRWQKETAKWVPTEVVSPPVSSTTTGFGSKVHVVDQGSGLQLVVESDDGYFVYDMAVDSTSVNLSLDSTLLAAPGHSFAMHGEALALGDPEAGDSGEVRHYKKGVTGLWELAQTLTPATLEAEDRFGYSLDFSPDGERLAVGAPGDPEWHGVAPVGSAPAEPAVHVYEWNVGTGLLDLKQTLEMQLPEVSTLGFGRHVRFLAADTLCIGAPQAEWPDSLSTLVGRLEVFKQDATSLIWEGVALQEGDAPSFGQAFVKDGNDLFVHVPAAVGVASGIPQFEQSHVAHLTWNATTESLSESRLLRFPDGGIVDLKADSGSLFVFHEGFMEQYERLPRVPFNAPLNTVVTTLSFNDIDLDWALGNLLHDPSQTAPPISVVESVTAELATLVPAPAQSPWALVTPSANPSKSRELVVQSTAHLQNLKGEVSWVNFQVTDVAGESDFETFGISVTGESPVVPAALQATVTGNDQISLGWQKPSHAPLGYMLERAPLVDYDAAVTASADLNTVFRKIARLQAFEGAFDDAVDTGAPGYAYRLKSWNDQGYSAYTSPVILSLFSGGSDWPVWWEGVYGSLDPSLDADGDGWTNLQEYQNGTNPLVADTDGDGQRDSDDNDPLNRMRNTIHGVLHTELVK